MGKAIFDANKETGELTITRIIGAEPEKVWDAWTTPEVFEKWWGPRGWTTTTKEFDVQPGGSIVYGMKCVDESQGEWFGKEAWGRMVFESVTPKNEMIYTDYFTDNTGKIDETMPSSTTKLQFLADPEGTKMVSVSTYESGEALQKVLEMGMEEGYNETLDRLEELLQNQ